ncbi:MAG: (Fe-S)-binding protein [Smithellaceae bacterium]|nr:(Fe-S)-binding protein [Smithellaceae bacterium]
MFDKGKCDLCGQCLSSCPYLDFDAAQGAAEFEGLIKGGKPGWLSKCITCFACNELCPRSARPFDLIVGRMEEKGDYVDPVIVSAVHERFTPKGEFKSPEIKSEKVLSLCTIEPIVPWAFQGPIFSGMDVVRGRFFFCNVLYPHIGNHTFMEEGARPLIERYAALGAKEIVFVHDDCYALMADVAPHLGIDLPFRPIHIFEHLRDYLKDNRARIKPLAKKIAYQRPCASRLTSAKEGMLDEILALIGCERVSRRYDREHALCCGQSMKGFMQRGDRYPAYQKLNVEDAKDHGAEAMVFLCPMCLDALCGECRRQGLETLMISDLCHLALGEKLPPEAYQNLS